jgi:hypothetical protein
VASTAARSAVQQQTEYGQARSECSRERSLAELTPASIFENAAVDSHLWCGSYYAFLNHHPNVIA